jgi:hypothetical protein
MKKALFMGGAVLLAFALVFSACNDAYDLNGTVTETETIPALAGPGNVKAVNNQAGVITLTWDPVYDAQGYEVWRKTGEEPAVKLDGQYQNPLFSNGSNRYDDIISATNLLKEGVEYTYTVVAVSSKSTSRGVEVVQNGISEPVTITPTAANIPATTAYTVPKVANLAVAQVTLPDGNKVVQVSWDKNPNPGVVYRGEINGESFVPPYNDYAYSLSPDGTKVVYDYWNGWTLNDGEQYKAKVTAFYSTGYYKAAAPAESEPYTHSGWKDIISDFGVSQVTVHNPSTGAESGYEVSVYWRQTQTLTGLTYELYKHEATIWDDASQWWVVPEHVEWDKVGIPEPLLADTIGFRQFKLTGTNVPAPRQAWLYKLVAKVDGEEVWSGGAALDNGVWSSPHIKTDGYADPVTVTPDGSKKIKIEVERVTEGLYAGEELEFYAVPVTLYNNTNQLTSSSWGAPLSQFTKIGGITKANLEDDDSTKRTIAGTVPSAGEYMVIGALKNGDTRIRISLYNSYNEEYPDWYVFNVSN